MEITRLNSMIRAVFHFTFHLLTGIALGLCISGVLFLYDPEIQSSLTHMAVEAFEKSLECKVSYAFDTATPLMPHIHLKEIYATSPDGSDWHWKAKKASISFSWWHLITCGILHIKANLYDFDAYSAFSNDKLAMQEHLKNIFTGPVQAPLFLKEIVFTNAHLTIEDHDRSMRYFLAWDSTSKKRDRTFTSHIAISDGSWSCHVQPYCTHAQGVVSITSTESLKDFPEYIAHAKLKVDLPPELGLPAMLYIAGDWNGKVWESIVKTSDPGCIISSFRYNPSAEKSLSACAEIPLSTIGHYFQADIPAQGTAQVNAHATCNFNAYDIQGTIAEISFQGSPFITNGTMQDTYENGTHTIHAQATHSSFGPFTLATHYSDQGIEATLLHEKAQLQTAYDFQNKNGAADITFAHPSGPLHLHTPFMYHKEKGISGTLDITSIHELLAQLYHYDLPGQGTIHYTLGIEQQRAQIALSLEKGALRLPHTYNHIAAAHATCSYDFSSHLLSLEQAKATLFKGTVTLGPAQLIFDTHYRPQSWHIPALLENCLITLERGSFAIVSGYVLSEKKENAPPLFKGHLVCEQAQLREQLLSAQWLQALVKNIPNSPHAPSFETDIALSLATKQPIRIKTDLLQTTATLSLHCTGSLEKPLLAGTLFLQGGHINLPYKPLYITRAHLTFHPEHTYDPTIELLAQNVIKKHAITVHMTGTLHAPHIMLSSSPALTDEQIVNLLITGSHEQSLNTTLPALMTQSLKNALFAGEKPLMKMPETITNLFDPLHRVHFIPRFADQTGRGGLRAAIDIDISDRLSVLLQKNFNLQEDTRLEVEYLLSDDICLRGVRDERKDVTGEVEMKWKF